MATTTLDVINAAIIGGNFTNEQLNTIVRAVTFARAQLAREKVSELTRGAKVSFVSTKLGVTMNGTVDKINRKFVIVNTARGNWRVPANMLTVV